MAVAYSCDGCGCAVENPKKAGFVLKRDYCDACEVIAQAFLEQEERERLNAAAEFKSKRDLLIAHFSINGFKLPDVP